MQNNPQKILVTIPHYFKPVKGGNHGSQNKKAAQSRAVALSQSIANLQSLFSNKQVMISHRDRKAYRANAAAEYEVTIIICAIEKYNLLEHLRVPKNAFSWHKVDNLKEPKELGFTCHDVLKENDGAYDYYCFMEDDLIINDPMFFQKLKWFNKKFGDDCVLSPCRFEMSTGMVANRVYIDGTLAKRARTAVPALTKKQKPTLKAKYGETEIILHHPTNIHSGAFFLNKKQMAKWAAQPHFGENDCSFISPLESAAGLEIVQNFTLYKPHHDNAYFLEIQHFGSGYAGQVGRERLPLDESLRDVYGDKLPYVDRELDI
ncbi:MAG: calcium-binding protein [Alphaproteobacteria bacterium]